ncbi:MAG TPA: hypothetical protein VI248_16690 [Kineosporiaceae bacterium]
MSAEPIIEPTSSRLRFPFQLSGRSRRGGNRSRHSASGATPAHRVWNGHERRSTDRLRRLARDYDALCTGAVDAAEVAAGLEASGFTDGSAREYGFPGIFALAEELYRQTPRLAERSPGRLANPWAERPLRHLTRGLTFALPGLVLVACLPGLTTRADLVAMTVAMLLGWPASQAIAFVGFALESRRHPRAAAAVLLLALTAFALAAGVLAVLAGSWGTSSRVAAIAAGEVVYIAAAAVVLVLSHELVIIGALLPGLMATACSWWVPGTSGWVVAVGAGTSVALITVAAVLACAPARVRDLRAGFAVLTRHDAVDTLFHLGYGLAGGVLITVPALAGPRTAAGSLALLPVIWSMGSAEWNVVRLRRRSFDLLNESISVQLFQRSVRRLAVTSLVRYLAELALLTAVLVAGIRITTGVLPGPPLAIALLASWVLGAGFYLALTLTSLDRVRAVVPRLALAVALALAASLAAPRWPAVLVGPVVLVLSLTPALRRTVADPVRHM